MSARREIEFQIVMGSKNPGTRVVGTYAQFYAKFFDIAASFVPPFEVLNDKLASGIDRAGEHGILLRWTPCQITKEEYELFCRELLTNPENGRQYTLLDCPSDVTTWDQWSWWIYRTQIKPLLYPPRRARSPEELDLKRQYRKALVRHDAATAAQLLGKIRKHFDPTFT